MNAFAASDGAGTTLGDHASVDGLGVATTFGVETDEASSGVIVAK